MKLTKKRVAIATAAAALATVGIFGGTYAKYSIETLPTTDNARLAKFYLKSDNELQLFSTGYKNSEMESADVANFFGFTDNLIAPNVATVQNLEFSVATEVKSKLTFSGLEIETNLPNNLWDYIKISVGGTQYTLTQLKASMTAPEYEVAAVVLAGTVSNPMSVYKVPVAFEWALENGVDDDETAAAIAQAEGNAPDGGYYLNLSGTATLTQID